MTNILENIIVYGIKEIWREDGFEIRLTLPESDFRSDYNFQTAEIQDMGWEELEQIDDNKYIYTQFGERSRYAINVEGDIAVNLDPLSRTIDIAPAIPSDVLVCNFEDAKDSPRYRVSCDVFKD